MVIDAVILAAGFGTRLAPITDDTPKPLIEVGGRPVISHLVDRLLALDDLGHIVVVTNGCHPTAWAEWETSASDPCRARGVELHLLDNGVTSIDRRLGAVADLRRGIELVASFDVGTGRDSTGRRHRTIVLGGDNLIDEDLAPHIDAAHRVDAPIVLCRDLGADVPPGRFGEVTIDSAGRVTGFREKPARPTSPLAATCTYVLDHQSPAELDAYLSTGDPDSPGSFVAWLSARRAVHARILTGRYFDIGNHETLARARAAFA